jgi:hypothetical protein
MLDEGVYTTVSEIGDAESISKSYVSRILRLALLSTRYRGGDPRRANKSGSDAGAAGAAAAGELVRAAPVARPRTVAVGITFSAEDGHARRRQAEVLGWVVCLECSAG